MTKTITRRRSGVYRPRIDWRAAEQLSCLELAQHGLHAQTIADATGLTIGQVHYRIGKVGTKLRNYRNGKSGAAKALISNFGIETIKPGTIKLLRKRVVTPINL